jgi:nitronate monooxygenase
MPHPLFGTRIIAAPMAGGTSTPGFVAAVHRAGGLGFLAAGYKSVPAMSEEMRASREAGIRFGVNVFVPDPAQLHPSPEDVDRLEQYRLSLRGDAERYGVSLPALRLDDDDHWQGKIDELLLNPVELVTFTFGLPESAVVAALRRAGSAVLATVTSRAEAELAADRGVDALVVQHSSAGAHSGAFLADRRPAGTRPSTAELVREVRAAVGLPLIAAGAVSDAADVTAVLAAGAEAAQVGTALLRTDESGARQLHKDALGAARFTETKLTRAFTGRYARALINDFVRDHEDAPDGYPAIHHLTAPIRAAAAAAGDAERLNLWAGTGWRTARTGPVADAISGLLGA